MKTPSKEPESSSMTHEEEEEMLHEISKCRNFSFPTSVFSFSLFLPYS